MKYLPGTRLHHTRDPIQTSYLILGAGRQGKAIAQGLAEINLLDGEGSGETTITLLDNNIDALVDVPHGFDPDTVGSRAWVAYPYRFDIDMMSSITSRVPEVDVVISALPYDQNFEVAKLCIEEGKPYVDLGGNFQVSEKIRELALKEARAPVMTDAGLAPGLANILALKLSCVWVASDDVLTGLYISCGGLPVDADIGYRICFHPDGLINEYMNDSLCLQNGMMVPKPPLVASSYSWPDRPALESFVTSGVITDWFVREFGEAHPAVQNISYETIRHEGHAEEVKKLLVPHSDFKAELIAKYGSTEEYEDVVLLGIDLEFERNTRSYSFEVHPQDGLTAMQVGTAYPTACIAHCMALGKYEGVGVLEYSRLAESSHFFHYLDNILKMRVAKTRITN